MLKNHSVSCCCWSELSVAFVCVTLLQGCASSSKVDIDAALKAPETHIEVRLDKETELGLLYPPNPLVGTGFAIAQGTGVGVGSCVTMLFILPVCALVSPAATLVGLAEGLSQISMPETARAFRAVLEREREKLVGQTGRRLAQAIAQLGNEKKHYFFSPEAETPESTSAVLEDEASRLTLIVSVYAAGFYKTTRGVVFRLSGGWQFEDETFSMVQYDSDEHDQAFWLDRDSPSRINVAWENALNGLAMKVVNEVEAKRSAANK